MLFSTYYSRNYAGIIDACLPRACMRMHTCSNAGKPDLEIIASIVNWLVMFIVSL